MNLKIRQLKILRLKKPSKKGLILSGVSFVLVAAILLGILLLSRSSKEAVGVYPFHMVGMDGYWGDSQESYGPVSTDQIQTVFLSDTQTVTEVLVSQGDSVKKGDVLMTFDTSLSDLQLERKRLEVEKLKLQLTEVQNEWCRIKVMKPMEDPGDSYFPTPAPPQANPGTPIPGAYVYRPNVVTGHDGKTPETAFICWLRSDTKIDYLLLDDMRQYLWGFYGKDPLCSHGNLPASCSICNPPLCPHGHVKSVCDTCSPKLCEAHKEIEQFCPQCHPPQCIHGADCILCVQCAHGVLTKDCPICMCPHGDDCTLCPKPNPDPGATETQPDPTTEATNPPASTGTEGQQIAFSGTPYRIQFLGNSTPPSTDMDFYVVFKTTTGDTDLGATSLWQGIHVFYKDGLFSQQFFVPMIEDYTQPTVSTDSTPVIPDFDFGSGYTATQLANMLLDLEKKALAIDFEIRMATANYKIMQKEVSDGKVYAEIDGTVVSLLTEEEAKEQKQPVVKVSGGGGFSIAGSVSELEKENLKVGQEVTVNDWSTGGVYTGTVKEIGDFPSIDGYWNGNGNPNTTYYPFTVFVGEDASLQAGTYANIQYSTSEAASGIYLEKAFLRTEGGRSYVYVRGADSRLEKRYITTGKTLWGSYVEVKSGITVDDYLAFPYGKDVKSGAPTRESDLSELYGF